MEFCGIFRWDEQTALPLARMHSEISIVHFVCLDGGIRQLFGRSIQQRFLDTAQYGRSVFFLPESKHPAALPHKANNPVQADVGSFFDVMFPQPDDGIAAASQLS